MAKATKRWAVRDDFDDSPYLLFVGRKPRNSDGRWSQPSTAYRCFSCGHHLFEEWFPKGCHLKRGGGPVAIEIEAVKT